MPGLGRLLAGTLLIINIYALVTVLILGLLWLLSKRDANMIWLEDALAADTPFSMFMLLATFVGMALGTMVAARHPATRRGHALRPRRANASALCHRAGDRGRHYGPRRRCVSFRSTRRFRAQQSLGRWIPDPALRPARRSPCRPGPRNCCSADTFKASSRRGLRRPSSWLVVPALLFGAFHFLPTLPLETGLAYVAFAGLFGVLAGDLTAQKRKHRGRLGVSLRQQHVGAFVCDDRRVADRPWALLAPCEISDTEAIRALIPVDLGLTVLTWFLIRRAWPIASPPRTPIRPPRPIAFPRPAA